MENEIPDQAFPGVSFDPIEQSSESRKTLEKDRLNRITCASRETHLRVFWEQETGKPKGSDHLGLSPWVHYRQAQAVLRL
jgi:hypothetical protein